MYVHIGTQAFCLFFSLTHTQARTHMHTSPGRISKRDLATQQVTHIKEPVVWSLLHILNHIYIHLYQNNK